MANEKILIVDDDRDMLQVLQLYLRENGFIVYTAEDGFTALELVEKQAPQLIILDVVMPEMDGFELCQIIRKQTDVPILFLSSKEDDMDKIVGLATGADDYLDKTTNLPVIVAKIKAHLRRNRVLQLQRQHTKMPPKELAVLKFPGLVIELDSAVVKVNDTIVKLSAKEYQILCLLAQNPDRIYSVEHLFELIWGEDSLGDIRTVMVHISNLRKKIERDPNEPYIHTFRGIGYKFSNFDD